MSSQGKRTPTNPIKATTVLVLLALALFSPGAARTQTGALQMYLSSSESQRVVAFSYDFQAPPLPTSPGAATELFAGIANSQIFIKTSVTYSSHDVAYLTVMNLTSGAPFTHYPAGGWTLTPGAYYQVIIRQVPACAGYSSPAWLFKVINITYFNDINYTTTLCSGIFSGQNFHAVISAGMETYGLTSCSQLPGAVDGGFAQSPIYALNSSGGLLPLSFSPYFDPQPPISCGWALGWNSGAAESEWTT